MLRGRRRGVTQLDVRCFIRHLLVGKEEAVSWAGREKEGEEKEGGVEGTNCGDIPKKLVSSYHGATTNEMRKV